ncbi:SBBP repeat-containing protein [Candidatus Villigracilis affinis]|uniref:SBBP repeat-containing protein n=1 Tax=Candidatus Villigracilis affinis TaxID=3140682 RepID=UPI002A234365|nr:SBBP repeat-containing protein [Anaerolineales bacterium]
MKTTSKIVFGILTMLMLLVMSLGAGPVEQVKAAEAESPLAANGDFVWAKGMGGEKTEESNAVVVDSSGNIYTTGYFQGTVDFDPGVEITNLTSIGTEDIFISKLDKSGNFVWAKNMGGIAASSRGLDIALSTGGSVYVTGSFNGTVDFNPGISVTSLTSTGSTDSFILKLEASGSFGWVKSIAGLDTYSAAYTFGIVVDTADNVYTTGSFYGTVDFDPGLGEYNLHNPYGTAFVFKLDKYGNFNFVQEGTYPTSWNANLGLMGPFSGGSDITSDSSGNIYIAGAWRPNQYESPDIYINKFDSDGHSIWAYKMGGNTCCGTDDAIGNSIVVDPYGNNIYITGHFIDTTDFDPGSGVFNLTSANGSADTFIAKYNGNGNFVWAKPIGGNGMDYGYRIALDSTGNIYTTGWFEGTVDFDPSVGKSYLSSSQSGNVFISKLDVNGNYVWAKNMGGGSHDLTLDLSDNIYLTGWFQGTVDFDPGANTAYLTSSGELDVFVTKLEGNPGLPTFLDVSLDHPLHDYIEALYDAGYTAGCSTDPLMYCPDTILDRAQSAVFMLRGQMGSGYTPPAAPWNTFGDDWTGFEWAEPWAEGMYQEGLTQGCQSSPLMFCPSNQLPRVEASVFGLRMKYGVNYTPPAASGTMFADFPPEDPSYWAIDWAEQAYKDGLLPACGTDSATGKPMFCPSQLVDRGWGAYLIVKAKNLPLP